MNALLFSESFPQQGIIRRNVQLLMTYVVI